MSDERCPEPLCQLLKHAGLHYREYTEGGYRVIDEWGDYLDTGQPQRVGTREIIDPGCRIVEDV